MKTRRWKGSLASSAAELAEAKGEPVEDGARCPKCGARLMQTSVLYYLCPKGHGKLRQAAQVSRERLQAEAREFERRMRVADQAVRKLQKG